MSKKSAYIGGNYVSSFENDFLKKNRAQYGTGCASGTSALFIALKSLGIGSKDEIIVPSHTFVATVEAIIHTGATPVFVDINPLDYTIDSQLIKKVINWEPSIELKVGLQKTFNWIYSEKLRNPNNKKFIN